jgi:sulfite dehydrogenase
LRRTLLAAGAAGAALAIHSVTAQEELVPGPGAELTQAKCVVCHEIEHVVRARQSRAEWEDTMRRMVQRGAPLAPDEIRVITDYLATYYNREGPSTAALAASAQAAAAQAQADPVTQLLNKNACLGCHAVEKQVVGPAFRDVAARYKGNASAPAALAKKLKEGGQGVWGQVPMPANPGLAEADAKLIVEWVLTRQ